VILFTEPIMLFITVHLSFIYGLVHLSLASYPVVFQQVHDMNLGASTLPGLGWVAGTVLGAVYIGLLQPAYTKMLFSNGGDPVPEWRLPASVLGGCVFAVGLFLFGWTGYKGSIHWFVPTLAGVLVGFGTYLIFIPLLNYLIDAYLVV
jgi:MFS transporter, DHA1 family, multidrug resistance protein